MDQSIGNDRTVPPSGKPGGHVYALKPGDNLGQYKVIKHLGAGGMGEVYEVEHQVLRLRYALKLLPPTLDWQGVSLERFRREAQVMAQLNHPNILKVDDFGETDGRYWLRMELAEGVGHSALGIEGSGQRVVSLQDLSGAYGGKVPQEVLLPILRQILEGLDYAHQHGAIHRDLKPSNILLSSPNTETRTPNTLLVRISDFGLVKLVGEEWVRSRAQLSVQRSMAGTISDTNTQYQIPNPKNQTPEGTSTRALLGTFEYMSPEQKRGEEADARSDLYAVGLMAYRLLTGRNIGPKLPSRIDSQLAPAWDDFVEKALEEDTFERLGSAAEGLRQLAEVASQVDEVAERVQKAIRIAEAERIVRHAEVRRLGEERKRGEEEQRRAAAEEEARRREQQPPSPAAPGPATPLKSTAPSRDPTAGNVLGMAFVEVAGGSFKMGSNSGYSNEEPVRTVRITRDFWIGKYEVTQRQYLELMGMNPSKLKGDDLPVEMVSWHDAAKFCEEFTKREQKAERLPAGLVYRLPTEAEWEYAARGGNKSRDFAYSGDNDLDLAGWYNNNSSVKRHSVGRKQANELGLHDMSGNVWEWCYDWYQNSYSGLSSMDPSGSGAGSGGRVIRGGSVASGVSCCRVSNRNADVPSSASCDRGFRVVAGAPVHAEARNVSQPVHKEKDEQESTARLSAQLDGGMPVGERKLRVICPSCRSVRVVDSALRGFQPLASNAGSLWQYPGNSPKPF